MLDLTWGYPCMSVELLYYQTKTSSIVSRNNNKYEFFVIVGLLFFSFFSFSKLLLMESLLNFTIHFIRLIKWKEGYDLIAFLSILVWIFICFYTHLVLYTLPIAIVGILYSPYNNNLNGRFKVETLKQELSFLALPHYYKLLPSLSIYILTRQLAIGCCMFYISLCGVGTRKLVWFCGTMLLSWNSHHLKVIRNVFHRESFILHHANKKVTQGPMTSSMLDRCYHFKIIESEHWWQYKGWTCFLVSSKQPKW